jgi:hypothetical protein
VPYQAPNRKKIISTIPEWNVASEDEIEKSPSGRSLQAIQVK